MTFPVSAAIEQNLPSAPEREVGPLWLWRALLLTFGWILFGWEVGERGLWSAHEGRAAQNAQSMLDTGQWLLPTLFTGEPETQKPPLYYWLAALAAKAVGGVNGISVRLPATIAGLLGLVLTFEFGRMMAGPRVGIAAALILATTTRYAWLARVGRIDMPLTCVTLIALYSFWYAVVRPDPGDPARRRVSWGIYLALAIGIMLKGPVALLLTFLPIVIWHFVQREPILPFFQPGWRRNWRRLRLVPGLALATALTAPWYVFACNATHGQFFWEFFVYHNVERALGTEEALKSGPVWFYLPRLLVDCFPWSLLLPALAIHLWKRRRDASVLPGSPNRAFLLAWIGTHFVFLSAVSFKRLDYLLPLYPGLALLLADWLVERRERFEARKTTRLAVNFRRRSRAVVISAFLVASISAPFLVWGCMQFSKKGGLVKTLFQIDVLDSHLNETDSFMMYHLERILREQWPLLSIVVMVVVASLWVLHTGWHERRNLRILSSLATPWAVCFLLQTHVLLPRLDPVRDMERFAAVIRRCATPERPIFYFGKFDPDLVFYAGKPARLLGRWEDFVALEDEEEPHFVVLKSSQIEWVRRDPRLRNWAEIANNCEFGTHREPRSLLTDRPSAVAARARESAEGGRLR